MPGEEQTKDLESLAALVLRVAKGEDPPDGLIDEPYGRSAVDWAKLRFLGRHLAAAQAMRGQPVFLVSLPRSGSSWIGEMLGRAGDAAYLREPMTQACIAAGAFETGSVTRYIDPASPPEVFERAARDAFLGLPNFPTHVVPMPGQWSLRHRGRRRLVIKEVNPLCLQWVMDAFRPRILLLLRHPAAVAQSRHRLGWETMGADVELTFPPQLMAGYREEKKILATAQDFWEKEGARQGLVTRCALDALAGYQDCKTIFYEDFCRSPLESFAQLYDFCGLTMTSRERKTITGHSAAGDRSRPYSRRRKSRVMARAWKQEVDPDAVQRVIRFYRKFGLDFYATD